MKRIMLIALLAAASPAWGADLAPNDVTKGSDHYTVVFHVTNLSDIPAKAVDAAAEAKAAFPDAPVITEKFGMARRRDGKGFDVTYKFEPDYTPDGDHVPQR